MIFGTPLTWFLAEILSVVLFVVCLIHASKQKDAVLRILELVAFLLYSGIFENIGVYAKIYDYDLHRIMLVGKVPAGILLFEAVIFYVGLRLTEFLDIPNWGKPFVVGFLASLQDMTMDPAAVFDLHSFNGVISGQWNWTPHYAGGFFNIPYFNFTGWMSMMVYYTAFILIGECLYKKNQQPFVGYIYPFAAALLSVILMVSPLNQLVLFGAPLVPLYTKNVELVLLVINFSIACLILLKCQKPTRAFNFWRDGIVIAIPFVLHLYDIMVAFALRIEVAYVPVVLVSAIHLLYLFHVIRPRQAAVPEKLFDCVI